MQKNKKPLRLYWDINSRRRDFQATIEGIESTLEIAQADIPVEIIGPWRSSNYLAFQNGKIALRAHESIDWYIATGIIKSRNKTQLNAEEIGNRLFAEPWRDPAKGGKDHYDVLLLSQDIYRGEGPFVVGTAAPGVAAIISTARLAGLTGQTRSEVLKTITMHEVGHLFGLIPSDRSEHIEYMRGKHCTNQCVMRQGPIVPRDWIQMTHDRFNSDPYCTPCTEALQAYFQTI